MANKNMIKQEEEVEALSAIYGDDWCTESDITKSYSIKIREKSNEITLYVTLPPEYPALTPPKYDLSAPWMERQAKRQLYNTLNEIYLKNVGESIIYQWVEKIRDTLQQMRTLKRMKREISVKEKLNMSKVEISVPDITHGEVIVDRKSVFQGHAAKVHSVDEVNAVIATLMQNKKIANATHNMYAYRIECPTPKGTVGILQESRNDGEAQAGGRMMHLMQMLDQRNTLVVVSRWYGGIQLGADRFRHINHATRQVIEQAAIDEYIGVIVWLCCF